MRGPGGGSWAGRKYRGILVAIVLTFATFYWMLDLRWGLNHGKLQGRQGAGL